MVDYKLEKALTKLFESGDYGKQEISIFAHNDGSIEILELNDLMAKIEDLEQEIEDLEQEIEDLEDER